MATAAISAIFASTQVPYVPSSVLVMEPLFASSVLKFVGDRTIVLAFDVAASFPHPYHNTTAIYTDTP